MKAMARGQRRGPQPATTAVTLEANRKAPAQEKEEIATDMPALPEAIRRLPAVVANLPSLLRGSSQAAGESTKEKPGPGTTQLQILSKAAAERERAERTPTTHGVSPMPCWIV